MSVGFVVHLNYKNPYLSPFEEFQRFKTHPDIAELLDGGKRIAYGARAITEGGYQSVPKLVFPGGALLGCSAGFVNVPRIKGVHNAMASGMQAADAAADALKAGRAHDELKAYEDGLARSPRSATTSSASATSSRCGRSSAPCSASRSAASTCGRTAVRLLLLRHARPRQAGPSVDGARRRSTRRSPIPGPTTRSPSTSLTSVFLSNTNHEEDQPVHLKVGDMDLQKRSEHDVYAGLSQYYCPAGVYEWVEGAGPDLRDQRAELRALQNLRHQGPQPEHHLGPARRAARGRCTRRCEGRGGAMGRRRGSSRAGNEKALRPNVVIPDLIRDPCPRVRRAAPVDRPERFGAEGMDPRRFAPRMTSLG